LPVIYRPCGNEDDGQEYDGSTDRRPDKPTEKTVHVFMNPFL
jgi:hypothetical protein